MTASYIETFVENPALDIRPDRTLMLRFELKHLGDFNYRTDALNHVFGDTNQRRLHNRADGLDRVALRTLAALGVVTMVLRLDRRCSAPPCHRHGCPVEKMSRPTSTGYAQMARIAPIANSPSMLKLARAASLASFAATLALAAGVLGQPYTPWPAVAPTASAQTGPAKTATAKSDKERPAAPSKGDQAIVVLVNDDPVTAYQIEQRARFLSLSTNLSEQVKENFQRLVKAESTNTQFRAIQEEVVRANQGKSREQIIAIFQERQKQFATNLQKQALDSARAGILPKLRKNAKEELIDERLKLQEAKKLGIEVSDADVKRFLQGLAESNKMTHDQFAQHLKGMGVDISTMAERMQSAESLARSDCAPLWRAGRGDAPRCRPRAVFGGHGSGRRYG